VDPQKVLEEVRKAVEEADPTALSEISKGMEGGDPFKVLIGTILSHRTRGRVRQPRGSSAGSGGSGSWHRPAGKRWRSGSGASASTM